jgi:hypothetical protein
MSKLPAIIASLKVVAVSVAVARGDMLPVVLISVVLNVTQLGAKPSSEKGERNSMVASRANES